MSQHELRQKSALEQRVAVAEHLHLLVLFAQASSRRARGVQQERAPLGGGGGGGGGGERQLVVWANSRRSDGVGVGVGVGVARVARGRLAAVVRDDAFLFSLFFAPRRRLSGRSSSLDDRLPSALALVSASRGTPSGLLVHGTRADELVEGGQTGVLFVFSVFVRARSRVFFVDALFRRSGLGSLNSVRVTRVLSSLFPVRASPLALSLAALARLRVAPRALQTQSAHLFGDAATLHRHPVFFVVASLVRIPIILSRSSRVASATRSFVAVPPPRRPGRAPAPSPQDRRVPLQAPVLLAQRAAERDAVQLAHVEFGRARRTRVDRAHAASASRTASGATRGRARSRRASPRPAPRRSAPADRAPRGRFWNVA